jgi:Na+/citrate or Na+/malate symporter
MTTALIFIVGAMATAFLGGWVVNLYLSTYTVRLKEAHERAMKDAQEKDASGSERGFPDGGKLIGQLERFLIFLFVMTGQIEGVGFLVAAKSVFRFGELSDHKNRLEAEYITIGTLMSFSWGFGASLLTKYIIEAVSKTP